MNLITKEINVPINDSQSDSSKQSDNLLYWQSEHIIEHSSPAGISQTKTMIGQN